MKLIDGSLELVWLPIYHIMCITKLESSITMRKAGHTHSLTGQKKVHVQAEIDSKIGNEYGRAFAINEQIC